MLSEFVAYNFGGIYFHKFVKLTGPYLGVSDANAAENIIKKDEPILKINGSYFLQQFTKYFLPLVSYKSELVL